MKNIVIKDTSWIYKLLTTGIYKDASHIRYLFRYGKIDTCGIFGRLFLAFLAYSWLTVCSIILAYSYGDLFAYLLASLVFLTWLPLNSPGFGAVVAAIVMFVLFIIGYKVYCCSYDLSPYKEILQAWKAKFCVKVKVVKSEDAQHGCRNNSFQR